MDTDRRTSPTDGGNDPVLDCISRRSYLKFSAVGATAPAAVAAGSGTAAAATGYGAGGYGEAGYGGTSDDAPVAVTTLSPADVGRTTVTLAGSLEDLGGASSADCAFEYRTLGASDWTTTAATTLAAPGSFSANVSGLASGTEHEYRAVAVADDGDADAGSVGTVTTLDATTAPTVERFAVAEAGSPNPHAEITVEWAVADGDGDLDTVDVNVVEAGGAVVDGSRHDVGGADAAGTDSFKIKHARGATFDVRLTVADGAGGTASAARTVTE